MNKDLNTVKTEHEKIRKRWLISLLADTAMGIIVALLAYFNYGLFQEISKYNNEFFSISMGFILSTLPFVLSYWISYHCAYKKRGTAWLMWTLIIIPIGMIFGYPKHLPLFLQLILTWNTYEWPFIAIKTGLEIYYWINCWTLRKINLSMASSTSGSRVL